MSVPRVCVNSCRNRFDCGCTGGVVELEPGLPHCTLQCPRAKEVIVLDLREDKIRILRERQSEERLRRLDELKKHALEAQQLREQKEAERRQRMDELRMKETERRSQVEGRKKMIVEAEQERREAILRKNQERDARVDAKRRNERSSIVFAFGSSTPRCLETYDSMYASYWGPRRATSTANLRLFPANANASAPSTNATPRRPSERDSDTKKRASSAGGLYRNPSDPMSTSMYEILHWSTISSSEKPLPHKMKLSLPLNLSSNAHKSLSPSTRSNADNDDGWNVARVGRRKTDLMPTTPSPRDTNSRPGSGSRSLARTPGRAVSMARLDQLARPRSQLSRSTLHLVEDQPLRTAKSMVALGRPQPQIVPRTTRAERLRQRARAVASARSPTSDGASSSGDVTPSRPGSVMSQSSVLSASTLNPRLRPGPRRPRPSSIHVTGVSRDKILSPSDEKPKLKENKVPPAKPITKKQIQQKNEEIKKSHQIKDKANVENGNLIQVKESVKKVNDFKIKKKKEENATKVNGTGESVVINVDETPKPPQQNNENNLLVDLTDAATSVPSEQGAMIVSATQSVTKITPQVENENEVNNAPILVDLAPTPSAEPQEPVAQTPGSDSDPNNDVSSSNKAAMNRSRITTEEEAKAVLAERRRLAREQLEREAEAERQRLAREEAEEEERRKKEEEEQRIAEEEQLRLIEEAKKVEEQRLMMAIQEAQKREEEEKERRRLEEQARVEKEEAERLAREEAEKQRLEMAERLKREEEERQARRKRVEAIMKRTRNAPPSNVNNVKTDCEKGEEDGAEHEKDDEPNKGSLEAFLHGERVSADRSLTNGSQKPALSNMNEDSHANGLPPSGITNEDCVNSNSPLATPLIAFQGKTKDTPVAADFLA